MLLAVLLFVSTVLPLPIDTPIPCLICRASAGAGAATFSGTISEITAGGLRVYDFTARRSMGFVVPSAAGDGLARAVPGLFARVTYTSSRGRNTAIRVLLLTGEQCRAMLAREGATISTARCPA
jgi:hypothetical protein